MNPKFESWLLVILRWMTIKLPSPGGGGCRSQWKLGHVPSLIFLLGAHWISHYALHEMGFYTSKSSLSVLGGIFWVFFFGQVTWHMIYLCSLTRDWTWVPHAASLQWKRGVLAAGLPGKSFLRRSTTWVDELGTQRPAVADSGCQDKLKAQVVPPDMWGVLPSCLQEETPGQRLPPASVDML